MRAATFHVNTVCLLVGKMKRIAIVKTFMRPEIFNKCVQALIAAGTQEILVAFDGPEEYWDAHRKIIFQANQIINADIYKFPYDYGLARCRNELIKLINVKYFLMIDDDILVFPGIWSASQIMQLSPKLAAATFGWFYNGALQIDAWDINIKENRILSKTVKWPKQIAIVGGFIFYYPFDFVPNQGFWSRKFFDEFKWDEYYIIEGEHEDLAMQAKASDWIFAVCANAFLLHFHGPDQSYHNERFSEEKMARSWLYFFKKWNLKAYEDADILLPPLPLSLLKKEPSIRESIEKWTPVLNSSAETRTSKK